MLDKILWNNILLPKAIKKQLVHQYTIPLSDKVRGNFFFSCIHALLKRKINKTSDTKQTHNQFINFQYDIFPSIFLLIKQQKIDINKLDKLFQWGLDPKIEVYNSYNLAHEVIFNYAKGTLSFEETKELLNCLFKNGVDLLKGNKSIAVYEKATQEMNDFPQNKNSDALQMVSLIVQILKSLDEKILSFVLTHEALPQDTKSLLDYAYLKELAYQVQMKYYTLGEKKSSDALGTKIEKLIDRGNIFKKQNHIYHSLRQLFSIEDLGSVINNRTLCKCYQSFSHLKTVAKKSLTTKLIEKKKETAIFNLLAYGLNLNWSIKNPDGKENIVGLEVLYSMPMIKMILSSDGFNICIANTRGENILHLLGSLPLMDKRIKEDLNKKLNNLSLLEKEFILNQVNDKGLTPLYKAIYTQEDEMIQYLLDLGVKVDEEFQGFPIGKESALSFVDNMLLPVARGEKTIRWVKVDDVSHEFWQSLSKKWNSNKMHSYLNNNMYTSNKIKKIVKI